VVANSRFRRQRSAMEDVSGLLIFTQDQGILSTQQKYLFNVVVTGIPLLLGLQTVVCPLRVGSREVRLLIAEN
jgi:hypothetical protein